MCELLTFQFKILMFQILRGLGFKFLIHTSKFLKSLGFRFESFGFGGLDLNFQVFYWWFEMLISYFSDLKYVWQVKLRGLHGQILGLVGTDMG